MPWGFTSLRCQGADAADRAKRVKALTLRLRVRAVIAGRTSGRSLKEAEPVPVPHVLRLPLGEVGRELLLLGGVFHFPGVDNCLLPCHLVLEQSIARGIDLLRGRELV